ncbi:hypothetical protein V8B97DRAFT_2003522 [Scleroderma yunnanense]
MTSGPPPSQAESSHLGPSLSSGPEVAQNQQAYGTSTLPVVGQSQNLHYGQPQPHTQQGQSAGRQNPTQTYYTMGYPPGSWQNAAWQLSGYPYATSGSAPYQQTHYTQIPYAQYQSYQPHPASTGRQRAKLQVKPRTPTPEPVYQHWDEVIRTFLKKVGLSQALKGFEDDMLIMSEDWEKKCVPGAIKDLIRDFMIMAKTLAKYKEEEKEEARTLEERKLDYIHLSNGQSPQTQSTTIKSISQFLAENRARNDISNRSEFIQSISEKRRRLNIDQNSENDLPSCARTDMKQLDRDQQMKYDIAKNEDGPLRRTMKGSSRTETGEPSVALSDHSETKDQHALDERLKNIETHLAFRVVPSPPRTLLARLQFLEDHIIQLEKEYPPWAALHFNQPHRGWPPPPRPTPIIVPSHLTARDTSVETVQVAPSTPSSLDSPMTTIAKGKGKNKSSLHRAVMEKLEVQRAMSDLVGTKKSE